MIHPLLSLIIFLKLSGNQLEHRRDGSHQKEGPGHEGREGQPLRQVRRGGAGESGR